MYSEDDLLPLSALQHLLFCERQCALIHIECVWDENLLTTEGKLMHEKVHSQEGENRKDLRIVCGLRLHSLRLGLSGIADVVEFHLTNEAGKGVRLPHKRGRWQPFPVEYKRGKPKSNRCDEVQLCAQAMCIEEMLGAEIPAGALFYGKTRRRKSVTLDSELRSITEKTAQRLHDLIGSGVTPRAVFEPKCKSCSLLDICMPSSTNNTRSVQNYLRTVFNPGEA